MWLSTGPTRLASAVPLLYAVRALATQLGLRRGRLLLQWAALVLAFVPMAIIYGHFEDVLALALVLVAFRDVFAGRSLRGALLLAAAIAFKQWSILAVPVFVVACPPALRRRAVAPRGRVAGGCSMGAFLAADYKYAAPALLHPPAFPALGHSALWIAPSTRYLASTPTRLGAVRGRSARRVVDPPATPIRRRSCRRSAVVLLCRFLFEPVVHAYYLAPGILVLLLAETSGPSRIRDERPHWRARLVAAFPFHPDRWLWWIAVYALTAILL